MHYDLHKKYWYKDHEDVHRVLKILYRVMNSLLKMSSSINIHHCFCKMKRQNSIEIYHGTHTLTKNYNI